MDHSGKRPSSDAGVYPMPEDIARFEFPVIAHPFPNPEVAKAAVNTLPGNQRSPKPHPVFGLFSFPTAYAKPLGTSAALLDDDPPVSPRTRPAPLTTSSAPEPDIVPVVSPPLEPAQIHDMTDGANDPIHDAYYSLGGSIPGLPLPGHSLPDGYDLSPPARSLPDDPEANTTSHMEDDEDDEPGYNYPPPDARGAVGPYFIHGITSAFQSAVAPAEIVTEKPKRTDKKKATKQAGIKPTSNRVAALRNEAQAAPKKRAPPPSPLILAGPSNHTSPSAFKQPTSSGIPHMLLGSPIAPPFEPLSPPRAPRRRESVENMAHSILTALKAKFGGSRKRKLSVGNEAGPEAKRIR